MIILTNKPGRLANRLFLFANFTANAKESGRKVLAASFDEYAVYFDRFAGTVCPRYPQRRSPQVSRKATLFRHIIFRVLNRTGKTLDQLGLYRSPVHACLVATHTDIFDLSDPALQSALDKPLVFVRNYFFHDLSALHRNTKAIRSYFAPGPRYLAVAKHHTTRQRVDCDLLIGLHIRRGDYRTWRRGKYYYSDPEYRIIAETVLRLFSGRRVKFLICSDEPVSPATYAGLPWGPGPGTEIGDLLAFSLCDYLLGPPSSYTRWAAFVGNVPLLVVENPDQDITLADFKDALDTPWASHQTVSPTGKYTPRDPATGSGEAHR